MHAQNRGASELPRTSRMCHEQEFPSLTGGSLIFFNEYLLIPARFGWGHTDDTLQQHLVQWTRVELMQEQERAAALQSSVLSMVTQAITPSVPGCQHFMVGKQLRGNEFWALTKLN